MAQKKSKKKKSKNEYYINGKELKGIIENYYNNPDDLLAEKKIGEAINKIATGLSFAPNFINYSYKDDMIGDAIVKMYSAIKNKKFDTNSGHNPFSYFTTIAFHAFINRIKKEKKHRDIITEYQNTVYHQMMEENGCYAANKTNEDDDGEY